MTYANGELVKIYIYENVQFASCPDRVIMDEKGTVCVLFSRLSPLRERRRSERRILPPPPLPPADRGQHAFSFQGQTVKTKLEFQTLANNDHFFLNNTDQS
jgi:hypothetical protein